MLIQNPYTEREIFFLQQHRRFTSSFSFLVLPHTGRCRAAGRNPAGTFQQSNEINLLTNRTDLSVKKQWRGHPIQKLDHTNVSVLGIVQRYEAMFQENWKLPW